jgi:cell division protein FtsB
LIENGGLRRQSFRYFAEEKSGRRLMAIERSAKTREQNRLSMWIAALIVGALIMVVLVTCGSLYRRLHSNKERIEELRSEIAKEEQRAEEIEEYKQYTKSREYIEEVAREKLGLVYEGEVIFKEGSSY